MVKCGKYSRVKFGNFVYFCITRGKALPHFEMCNYTKFRMLFLAVPMNFLNSKVCLIGEWSIAG